MENRKLVYTTTQDHMAAMIKGALEAEGLNVLVMNHKDSAYTVLGDIELYVATEEEARAKEIISQGQE
ncbi:MAG: hypothetical protein GQ574_22420 [Crocinitomix sp.]|nr:hypothetical protein [Crocinitomix sp.]